MILGAVIAGGGATRFGSDKALTPLAGRPMIEHVIAALSAHVDRIVVCGRTYGDHPMLADQPGTGLGPLGGINAALHFAGEAGFAGVLTLPCDTPLIEPALLAELAQRRRPTLLADCPVIGWWPAVLGPELDRYLAAGGNRSVRAWADTIGAERLPTAAPANVNRMSDLDALIR